VSRGTCLTVKQYVSGTSQHRQIEFNNTVARTRFPVTDVFTRYKRTRGVVKVNQRDANKKRKIVAASPERDFRYRYVLKRRIVRDKNEIRV